MLQKETLLQSSKIEEKPTIHILELEKDITNIIKKVKEILEHTNLPYKEEISLTKTKHPRIIKVFYTESKKGEIIYYTIHGGIEILHEFFLGTDRLLEDFDENNVIIYRSKKYSAAFKLIEHNGGFQLKKCLEGGIIVKEGDYYLSKNYFGKIVKKIHKDNCY